MYDDLIDRSDNIRHRVEECWAMESIPPDPDYIREDWCEAAEVARSVSGKHWNTLDMWEYNTSLEYALFFLGASACRYYLASYLHFCLEVERHLEKTNGNGLYQDYPLVHVVLWLKKNASCLGENYELTFRQVLCAQDFLSLIIDYADFYEIDEGECAELVQAKELFIQ